MSFPLLTVNMSFPLLTVNMSFPLKWGFVSEMQKRRVKQILSVFGLEIADFTRFVDQKPEVRLYK